MMSPIQPLRPLTIKNSPIEFLVVARFRGEFRPIIKSENCGLDLLGFASSKSYFPFENKHERTASSIWSVWRNIKESHVSQFLEMGGLPDKKFTLSMGRLPKTFFYWKGVELRNSEIEKMREITEMSVSASLFAIKNRSENEQPVYYPNESYKTSSNEELEDNVSWTLSPVIQMLTHFEKRRSRSRDFRFIFFLFYMLFVILSVSSATSYLFMRF